MTQDDELTRAERNALSDEAMKAARKKRFVIPQRPDPQLAELLAAARQALNPTQPGWRSRLEKAVAAFEGRKTA